MPIRISFGLVLILVIGYLIGAKWPMLAQKIGWA